MLVGACFLYDRYISKLDQSHPKIFVNLILLLSTFTISAITFLILFSLYLSSPQENKSLFEYGLIAYYVALLTWTAFFVYLSPGLLDKVNGIAGYQFVLYIAYTFIMLIYPILFLVISGNNTTDSDDK